VFIYIKIIPFPFQKGQKADNNLTPCVPLSASGEGEGLERGADAPLRRPAEFFTPSARGGENMGGGFKAPGLDNSRII
jgi:hypothetical protein